jgi:hypothetical protein
MLKMEEARASYSFDYKKFWEELMPTFPQYDMDCKENNASNSSSLPQEHVYQAVA